MPDSRSAKYQLDDCWNNIGIHGDRSCQQLSQYVHCHHCPVYALAAKRILDFYTLSYLDKDVSIASLASVQTVEQRVLIFRLGEQWLGLTLDIVLEVSPLQIIHSLPHRRSEAVLGVSNVRGALVACLSLTHLLALEQNNYIASGRVTPRMLIVGHATEGKVVFPVDDVQGIHALPEQKFSHHSDIKFSKVMFKWQSYSVSLIDNTWLLAAIKRSLT